MSKRITECDLATDLGRGDSLVIARSGDNYRVPMSLLGDGATFVVAADDANVRIKAKADYICDGAADNVQIQQALDALIAGRDFKERVRLVGNFVLSAEIVLPSYTILDMREASLTRDAETTFNIIEVRAESYVDIVGGVIDGNDANVTPKGNDELNQMNVLLQDVTYCSVRGVTVKNATQNGIYLYDNCLHNLIEGNWVDGNRRAGILLFFIDAGDGPKYNMISNNVCINNLINRPGIYLSGANTRKNTVIGNVCQGNTGNGIRLDAVRENTLVGNVSADNDTGVYVTNGATDNQLIGNYFYNNTSSGLYFLANCDRNVALGNYSSFNGHMGLRSGGEYTRFCDNVLYANDWNGIQLEAGADYSLVADNLVLNNSQSAAGGFQGIYLWDVNYCSCSGNISVDDQVVKTQSRGIYESNAADYNLITGNIVTPNRTTPYIRLGGANTICKNNIGFVTENGGTSAAIATGGTIAHGLAATPIIVQVNAAEAGPTDITISVDATDITVNFGGGGNRTFFWSARVDP